MICTPSLGCEHGKRKYGCAICTPSLRCEHGKRKRSCADCKKRKIDDNDDDDDDDRNSKREKPNTPKDGWFLPAPLSH